MIGKAMTKLIIVCDDKTKEYANYLRQLISVNDDLSDEVVGTADGTVDAAVWSEKEYKDQEKTISSNEHVLFIGENKTSQSETRNMSIKFEKFGMKFGWLGKRGMMQVDDDLLDKEEYLDFIDYCSTYKQYFEKLAYKEPKLVEQKDIKEVGESTQVENVDVIDVPRKKDNKMAVVLSNKVAVAVKNVLEPVGEFFEAGAKGAVEGVKAHLVHKKIIDQQYRVLTVILYLDGLKEFLEG